MNSLDYKKKDYSEDEAYETNPLSSRASVIIPAYNEGMAIGNTIKELTTNPALLETEIIIVNDGSVDDTASVVAQFPKVKLISHRRNKGYGSALVTGMSHATKEFVIWMDSDGQHRVEDLISVMNKLIENDLDYCIGIRTATSYQDPSRKLGKLVLKFVVQMIAGKSVSDFNSGLRGFRRSIIKKYLHLLPSGFGASTTTTLIMTERHYKGEEVVITVLKRIGKSSVKQFRDGMRTLNLILHIFLLFKPLRFFGSIGLLMFATGLAYGLLTADTEGRGFPVLGAVVLLSGLQTIFTGLVMDHISAIRRERFV